MEVDTLAARGRTDTHPPHARSSLAVARRTHLVSMLLVALIASSGLALMYHLHEAQSQDAEIVNIAGRQRMLSQRMASLALLELREPAAQSLAAWRVGQRRLLGGDLGAFADASPPAELERLVAEAEALEQAVDARLAAPIAAPSPATSADRDALLAIQEAYLSRMDRMVFRYSAHADEAVHRAQLLGLVLGVLLVGLLLVEYVVAVRPQFERVGAQIDTAERDARYVRALRSAELGVWEWDRATDEVRWSTAFAEIVGFTEAVEPTWTALAARFDDDGAARFETRLAEVARGGEMFFEARVRLDDGGARWVRLMGRDHDARYVAGVIADIDDERRRQAERQRLLEAHDRQLSLAREGLADAQVMSAVHSLASGMAHDMNNLLQVIRASVELLQDGDEDPSLIGDVLQAVDEASAITGHMLALKPAGPDSHRPLNTRSLLADVAPVLRRAVPARIRFEVRDDDLGEQVVAGSRSQLQRALLNLVINACDAIDGPGHITLSAAPRHCGVEFAVRDDGRGMPAELLDRVLEPFFTTKSGARGTGLGLAVVHACTLGHGGTLTVESAEGNGTVVRMWLPSSEVSPEQDIESTVHAPPTTDALPAIAADGESPLVMLVDDEPRVRAGLERALGSLGFRVAALSGGDAALSWLGAGGEEPVAIVCDVVMPGMLGPEVVRRVRERLSRPLPAVLMSGNHAADLQLSQPTCFLRKPYGIDQLEETLGALLTPPPEGSRTAA